MRHRILVLAKSPILTREDCENIGGNDFTEYFDDALAEKQGKSIADCLSQLECDGDVKAGVLCRDLNEAMRNYTIFHSSPIIKNGGCAHSRRVITTCARRRNERKFW